MQDVSNIKETQGRKTAVQRWFYTNTSSDSILKCNSTNEPTVNNNDINHFLPGANQDNDKRAYTEITEEIQKHFKDVFSGIGSLMENFHFG